MFLYIACRHSPFSWSSPSNRDSHQLEQVSAPITVASGTLHRRDDSPPPAGSPRRRMRTNKSAPEKPRTAIHSIRGTKPNNDMNKFAAHIHIGYETRAGSFILLRSTTVDSITITRIKPINNIFLTL